MKKQTQAQWRFAAALLTILSAWPGFAADVTLDLALPKGMQVDSLFQPDGPKAASSQAAFDVDPDGLPAFADGTTLKVLGSSQEMLSLGVLPIDDFAWMRDDALLFVTQGHLASLSHKGVSLSLALPARGMRIRPAGDDTAYVFGGATEPENHDVYLFARDGTATKLASLPMSVSSVAGNGTTSYIATGRVILRVASGQPARVLLQANEPIISLELAPGEGLFYATKTAVGYIDGDGAAYEFMRGAGGALRARGSSLYVLMPDGNLLQVRPLNAFAQLAKK